MRETAKAIIEYAIRNWKAPFDYEEEKEEEIERIINDKERLETYINYLVEDTDKNDESADILNMIFLYI